MNFLLMKIEQQSIVFDFFLPFQLQINVLIFHIEVMRYDTFVVVTITAVVTVHQGVTTVNCCKLIFYYRYRAVLMTMINFILI